MRNNCTACLIAATVAHGSKMRLVLDSRHVNQYIEYEKIVLEDWSVFANMVQRGDYLINFDYTAGCHHIPIAEAHQKFLGFQFEDKNGNPHFYLRLMDLHEGEQAPDQALAREGN